MSKTMLDVATLDSLDVFELPDRELLGSLITIGNINVLNILAITKLHNVLNNNFNNWDVNVLSGNTVEVDVEDNLSDNDVAVFCNQIVAVLAAQCLSHKRY
jgi:hypothetical protein